MQSCRCSSKDGGQILRQPVPHFQQIGATLSHYLLCGSLWPATLRATSLQHSLGIIDITYKGKNFRKLGLEIDGHLGS